MNRRSLLRLVSAASFATLTFSATGQDGPPGVEEVKAIAKEAYIYGNSKEEAMYPAYRADAAGKPMDASKQRYTLRFAPGQLPPVDAFWSVTMYELPSSLLAANPLNRYLINSPMLPGLKKDADGGLTLYLQHESPGADKESNWLPAPKGPFWCAMRLYRPQQAALDGGWKQPPLQAIE